MDQVVQQNASLVEEATAATESMKEQAGSLRDMVSRFRLGGERAKDAPSIKAVRTVAPKPAAIKVRSAPMLPPARAAAFGRPRADGSAGNGEWKEF